MTGATDIPVKQLDEGRLHINADFTALLSCNGIQTAKDLWALDGMPVKKAVKTRGTSRAILKGTSGKDVEVYIKRYLKPTLKDRIKCAVSFKPVFADGALHEWKALCRFHKLGLRTMTPIAAANCGQGRTCNLTLGITEYVRASDLFETELKEQPERRQAIIKNIARLLGEMHSAGLAHQDFYLVHLFIKPKENDAVYLIDLQRTIIQKTLSRRWKVKDLAQIHYALTSHATLDEIERFRTTYAGINPSTEPLWKSVERKSGRIRKHTEKHRF